MYLVLQISHVAGDNLKGVYRDGVPQPMVIVDSFLRCALYSYGGQAFPPTLSHQINHTVQCACLPVRPHLVLHYCS